jgi:hypothetical protein
MSEVSAGPAHSHPQTLAPTYDAARWLPYGLFLASWSVYASGAAPSLYGGDSGELIASAAGLGVSHAPGYPLHALLGKLFLAVLPWGGPALRVNLLSAALTAATVSLLFLLLRRVLAGAAAALLGALLYASFPIVWDQAQLAEVFALNNLAAAAVAYCAARSGEAASRRWLFLGAFLFGLGLGNHQTLLLLGPALGWSYLRNAASPERTRGENLRAAARRLLGELPALAACAAAGLSVYAFIALRAAHHPAVNFGDPHTWRRFWDVLLRREFGSLELHPAALPFHTGRTLGEQVAAYARGDDRLLGGLAATAGFAGLVLLCLRRPAVSPPLSRSPSPPRDVSWLLAWSFAGIFFYVFSNLSPHNTLAQWRLERFRLLPALFTAVGAAALWQAAWTRRFWWAVALLPLGLAVEQATVLHHPWFRWNLAFRDFGRNLCASLEPGSTLLIDSVLFDEPTSCLLVRRETEGKRRDVRPVYRPGTLFELYYGEDILEIPREDRARRRWEREEPLWPDFSRPLAALAFAKDNVPVENLSLRGPVYVRRDPARDAAENAAPRMDFAAAFHVRRHDGLPTDYPTRLILVHEPYFAAKAAFEAGDDAAARRADLRARRLGRDMEWLLSNLGSLWSRASGGRADAPAFARARERFEASVAVDPYFPQGQFGLGYARLTDGRRLEAVRAFEQAVRLRPGWEDAWYMLGLAHHGSGRPENARAPWERFLALSPDSPLAADVRRALAGR